MSRRGVSSGREMRSSSRGRDELTSRSGNGELNSEETLGNSWMEQRRQIMSQFAAELCS